MERNVSKDGNGSEDAQRARLVAAHDMADAADGEIPVARLVRPLGESRPQNEKMQNRFTY